jgi:hypothetical protein
MKGSITKTAVSWKIVLVVLSFLGAHSALPIRLLLKTAVNYYSIRKKR